MQHYPGNVTDVGGWVTTRQAAAALRVKPRQIRNYISNGELVAKTDGESVNKRYLVSVSSIEELRQKREAEGKLPERDRNGAENSATQEQDAATLARELAAELGEAHYRLGRAEARLELTAEAESTIREQLQRERERAERLEAQREQLLPDLLREKDRADAERERAEHFEAKLREALEARRGWFRRFFGF